MVKNVSTLLLLSINLFYNITNKTIDSFEIVATKCLTLNTMHMIVTLVLYNPFPAQFPKVCVALDKTGRLSFVYVLENLFT